MKDARSLQFQLQTVRDELHLLQDERALLQSQLQRAQADAAHTLQRIREIVIAAIRKGEQFDWTILDERVSACFKQLSARHEQLLAQVQGEESSAATARANMHTAIELLDQANAAVEQLEQQIDAATDQLPGVQKARATLEEISLLTERLTEQQADAEEDAANKRKAYEADPYFTYLWRRGYGTPAYKSEGRIGRMDRWLAERCHYRDNAARYEMLLAIPVRLQETLEEATAQLASLQEAIAMQRAEQAALLQHSVALQHVQEAESLVARTRAQLAAHSQRIEAARQEIAHIETGEHGVHRDIAALVARAVDNENVARYVQATFSREDDALLQQFEVENLKQYQLQAQLSANGAAQQLRLGEIEQLQHEYQRAKGREEAAMRALMLPHVLRGMGRHGGGFGGWAGTGTGSPGGRKGGGGGFGGGGFGGGGFGRGGGFGGGGFKRGGGF